MCRRPTCRYRVGRGRSRPGPGPRSPNLGQPDPVPLIKAHGREVGVVQISAELRDIVVGSLDDFRSNTRSHEAKGPKVTLPALPPSPGVRIPLRRREGAHHVGAITRARGRSSAPSNLLGGSGRSAWTGDTGTARRERRSPGASRRRGSISRLQSGPSQHTTRGSGTRGGPTTNPARAASGGSATKGVGGPPGQRPRPGGDQPRVD